MNQRQVEMNRLNYFDFIKVAVPISLFMIIMLGSIQALTSRWNAHPDEHVHFSATQYYKNHLLPPAPCQADIKHTYSAYGYSRLDKEEISYFFAGKFLQITDVLPGTDLVKARIFNLVLLLLIALLATRHIYASILALPWLISPQIWYLYSYVNSEAFVLFICYLVLYQVVLPNSLLKNYLKKASALLSWKMLVLSGLFACVCLVKINFYFFILYLCGIALLFMLANQSFIKSIWPKIIAITTVTSVLVIGLKLIHWSASDFHHEEAKKECHFETAYGQYREDKPLQETHSNMYLKDKGYDLSFIFEQGWTQKMWQTSMGYYGYLEYKAPDNYYNLMLLGLLLLIGMITLSYLKQSSWLVYLEFLGAIAVFVSMLIMIMWMSWTFDLQAQGRYTFSMIPILGYLLYRQKDVIKWKYTLPIIAVMYVTGLYQFIYYALVLPNILN